MSWPTGVASDTELVVATNNFQTTLNGAIDAVTTTVVLADASGLPTTGGYVTIGTEAIKFTGKSGNTLTGVTRGADSTTAASHSNGVAVLGFIVAAHHNLLKDEIKAIETSLDLTASRAVVSSASGRVTAATTTSTEIGYVNGVTSAIQTQINTKAPSASPTFTGTVTTPLTASRAVATGASSELAASATTATELGYVSGVTSAIQTQIDGKATDANVVHLTGAESITGAKTFDSSALKLKEAGGGSDVLTVAVASLGSAQTITVPDPGASALVVLSTSSTHGKITPWAAYTPTLTGFGTPSNVDFYWRQVCDTVEIRGAFLSGTNTATSAKVTIPSGFTIDDNKVPDTQANTGLMGIAAFSKDAETFSANSLGMIYDGSDTDELYFAKVGDTGDGWAKMDGNGVNNGCVVTLFASFPVT